MYKILILLFLSFFQINLQTTPIQITTQTTQDLINMSKDQKPNLLTLSFPQSLAVARSKDFTPNETPSNEIEDSHTKSIYDLMKSRYTVRTFKPQDLKKGHLDQILGAGLLAPSKNEIFPYRIIVLTNSRKGKRLKRKLWSKHTICYHCSEAGDKIVEQRINSILTAPVNIVFFLDIKPEKIDREKDLSKIKNRLIFRATRDAMISATAMMLQAEQLGYGTAFTGVNTSMNKFKKQLKVPLGKNLVTLSIGYRKEPSKTIPKDYKAPKIDLDCQGQILPHNRYTVLKYSNKRNKEGLKLPSVITKSIDVGPKNTEKTHLIKKY